MPARPSSPPRWDVFCRVIDNYGDAGVCWRLAAGLAARGCRVRLVIDDPAPLRWLAPQGAPGVQVLPWPGPAEPADVVVEAFGCDPPAAYVEHMARATVAPRWLNLEYLSAERYVERSHGLPSPQRNGLVKTFFFPGFTPGTGGLLREPELLAERAAFDRHGFLAGLGLQPRAGERVVTLFCYDNPALPDLLADLDAAPTLLLLTPGHAQRLVTRAPPGVRLHALPFLPQTAFDRLLWSSDLAFVRGEDSLVRAIWAGVPFVWQAYPQHDGAHHAKVQALLEQAAFEPPVATLWHAWNGSPTSARWPGLPALAAWQPALQAWRARLLAQDDLVTQLLGCASGKALE